MGGLEDRGILTDPEVIEGVRRNAIDNQEATIEEMQKQYSKDWKKTQKRFLLDIEGAIEQRKISLKDWEEISDSYPNIAERAIPSLQKEVLVLESEFSDRALSDYWGLNNAHLRTAWAIPVREVVEPISMGFLDATDVVSLEKLTMQENVQKRRPTQRHTDVSKPREDQTSQEEEASQEKETRKDKFKRKYPYRRRGKHYRSQALIDTLLSEPGKTFTSEDLSWVYNNHIGPPQYCSYQSYIDESRRIARNIGSLISSRRGGKNVNPIIQKALEEYDRETNSNIGEHFIQKGRRYLSGAGNHKVAIYRVIKKSDLDNQEAIEDYKWGRRDIWKTEVTDDSDKKVSSATETTESSSDEEKRASRSQRILEYAKIVSDYLFTRIDPDQDKIIPSVIPHYNGSIRESIELLKKHGVVESEGIEISVEDVIVALMATGEKFGSELYVDDIDMRKTPIRNEVIEAVNKVLSEEQEEIN